MLTRETYSTPLLLLLLLLICCSLSTAAAICFCSLAGDNWTAAAHPYQTAGTTPAVQTPSQAQIP